LLAAFCWSEAGPLTAYREGNPTPIVEMIAEASFRAIDNGRALTADLGGIRRSWDELITVRRGATAHHLAGLVVSQPVVDSALAQRELSVAGSCSRGRRWVSSRVLQPGLPRSDR
jgi:hypothetical protein